MNSEWVTVARAIRDYVTFYVMNYESFLTARNIFLFGFSIVLPEQ